MLEWVAFRQFDLYNIRARIMPALLAGAPILSLFLVIVPWDRLGLTHLIVSVVSLVLLFAFSDLARSAGLRAEAKLGTRATPELWHHDNHEIDLNSKQRYKEFISSKINMIPPTAEDELSDRDKANIFYFSAANWLREKTRDNKKYKILFEDLITYGFRKNLFGLKLSSLFLNGLVLIFCLYDFIFGINFLSGINHVSEKISVICSITLMHSLYMIFVVNKEGVYQASKSYGKTLILTCESMLNDASGPPPAKKRKSKSLDEI